MTLSTLELELAAISASIAAGCIPCSKYHILEAGKHGASDGEVARAVDAGGTLTSASLQNIWCRFTPEMEPLNRTESVGIADRQALLCAVGTAIANNDVTSLRSHLQRLGEFDVGDCEAMAVIGLAERIKEKAASHLEPVIDTLSADRRVAREAARLCT